MAQGNYNEPFFWHNIKNVGWGNLVGFVEMTHGLINWSMVTIATVDVAGHPADVNAGPGFNDPFSKKTGLIGSGWESYTTADFEDEGIAQADAFVVTPAHDVTIVHEFQSFSTPSASWADDAPIIGRLNNDADHAAGAGNWYAIKYVGPTTTIPHSGSEDGDPVPIGTTIMIWYHDEVVHFDDEMGTIYRHAFLVNFVKAKTVRVSVPDATPRGTTTHWTVRIYSDSSQFVQHSDGLVAPVNALPPIREFSGSAPDSTLGTLFTFDKNGFVT